MVSGLPGDPGRPARPSGRIAVNLFNPDYLALTSSAARGPRLSGRLARAAGDHQHYFDGSRARNGTVVAHPGAAVLKRTMMTGGRRGGGRRARRRRASPGAPLGARGCPPAPSATTVRGFAPQPPARVRARCPVVDEEAGIVLATASSTPGRTTGRATSSARVRDRRG